LIQVNTSFFFRLFGFRRTAKRRRVASVMRLAGAQTFNYPGDGIGRPFPSDMRLSALCLANARETLARIGIAAAWAGSHATVAPMPPP
jgi:hypothetical protein